MGEANDIAKLLDLKIEFTASKEGDELLIHYTTFLQDRGGIEEPETETGEFKEKHVISMKDFYREYRKLKRMQ